MISPLLANIYLHYCFDLWAERWRRREARGDMIVVRYADDLVVGFEHEGDARRFLDAMRDRLGEFALSLHPDKTRLIKFGRFAATDRELGGLGKPGNLRVLGLHLHLRAISPRKPPSGRTARSRVPMRGAGTDGAARSSDEAW